MTQGNALDETIYESRLPYKRRQVSARAILENDVEFHRVVASIYKLHIKHMATSCTPQTCALRTWRTDVGLLESSQFCAFGHQNIGPQSQVYQDQGRRMSLDHQQSCCRQGDTFSTDSNACTHFVSDTWANNGGFTNYETNNFSVACDSSARLANFWDKWHVLDTPQLQAQFTTA